MPEAEPPRFYHPLPLEAGRSAVLSGEEAAHAAGSLRLAPGDAVELVDGAGRIAAGTLTAARRGRAEVSVSRVRLEARPDPEFWLGPAIIRGPRFDQIVEKATELGAAAILPLLTRHTGVLAGGLEKPERWRRIAVAAMKQSRRSWVPRIDAPGPPGQALNAAPFDQVWVAEPGPAEPSPPPEPVRGRILLLVGPEGGWHPDEIGLFRVAGCAFISLGAGRLRTETAALSLLVYARMRAGLLGVTPGPGVRE